MQTINVATAGRYYLGNMTSSVSKHVTATKTDALGDRVRNQDLNFLQKLHIYVHFNMLILLNDNYCRHKQLV